MSILAESKAKAKWILNPTKKSLWINDSNGIKFGRELMERMGWSTGKGLGLKEQGIHEPLKVHYKNDTKGIGYKENDDDWINHQDEFNLLLARLSQTDNAGSVKTSDNKRYEVMSLEEKSKNSKARIHYQKFTRGKDLSKYSENDLACILGINKMKKEKSNPVDMIKTEANNNNEYKTSFGVTTVNSGYIQDYFKKKLTSNKTRFNSFGTGVAIENSCKSSESNSDFSINFDVKSDVKKKKSDKRKHKTKVKNEEIPEVNESFCQNFANEELRVDPLDPLQCEVKITERKAIKRKHMSKSFKEFTETQERVFEGKVKEENSSKLEENNFDKEPKIKKKKKILNEDDIEEYEARILENSKQSQSTFNDDFYPEIIEKENFISGFQSKGKSNAEEIFPVVENLNQCCLSEESSFIKKKKKKVKHKNRFGNESLERDSEIFDISKAEVFCELYKKRKTCSDEDESLNKNQINMAKKNEKSQSDYSKKSNFFNKKECLEFLTKKPTSPEVDVKKSKKWKHNSKPGMENNSEERESIDHLNKEFSYIKEDIESEVKLKKSKKIKHKSTSESEKIVKAITEITENSNQRNHNLKSIFKNEEENVKLEFKDKKSIKKNHKSKTKAEENDSEASKSTSYLKKTYFNLNEEGNVSSEILPQIFKKVKFQSTEPLEIKGIKTSELDEMENKKQEKKIKASEMTRKGHLIKKKNKNCFKGDVRCKTDAKTVQSNGIYMVKTLSNDEEFESSTLRDGNDISDSTKKKKKSKENYPKYEVYAGEDCFSNKNEAKKKKRNSYGELSSKILFSSKLDGKKIKESHLDEISVHMKKENVVEDIKQIKNEKEIGVELKENIYVENCCKSETVKEVVVNKTSDNERTEFGEYDSSEKLVKGNKVNLNEMNNEKTGQAVGDGNVKKLRRSYEGNSNTSEKVLDLIRWADIKRFRGSNLGNVLGYGFMKEYLKNTLR